MSITYNVLSAVTERAAWSEPSSGGGKPLSKVKIFAAITAVALGILAIVGSFFALVSFVPFLGLDLILLFSIIAGAGVATGVHFACTAIANKILKKVPSSSISNEPLPPPNPKTPEDMIREGRIDLASMKRNPLVSRNLVEEYEQSLRSLEQSVEKRTSLDRQREDLEQTKAAARELAEFLKKMRSSDPSFGELVDQIIGEIEDPVRNVKQDPS